MNNFKGWRDKPEEDNSAATLAKLDEVLGKIEGGF